MDAQTKPNILVIMGDDIGWMNPSCYHRGMMGFWTPNIDHIARDGELFTTGMANKAVLGDVPPSSPGSASSGVA